MKIALYGDSLTEGMAGVSYLNYLQELLPGHELLNYGKGGDTVISLYQRIVRQQLVHPVDVIFLFVGVNDIFVHVSRHFHWLKTLARQPWVKDVDEFARYYQKTLDLLTPGAARVFTVSPLLIGENVANVWNKELAALCETICRVSVDYGNVDYLDLRADFTAALDPDSISPYVIKSATRVVLDTLFLNDKKIDRESAARGLQLTLDGVHLNSQGARLVAENFDAAIRSLNHKEKN
ncbi:SGNH/GDSL hydrolase family protein [Chloroflexota bacterium]